MNNKTDQELYNHLQYLMIDFVYLDNNESVEERRERIAKGMVALSLIKKLEKRMTYENKKTFYDFFENDDSEYFWDMFSYLEALEDIMISIPHGKETLNDISEQYKDRIKDWK